MQKVLVEYEHWRRAIEAPGANADAYFNCAWWATRMGRFTEALEAYQRAIDLGLAGPEEAYTNMASVYSERLGQPARAMPLLAEALRLNPAYFPAVFNRAHLAEQMGDRDDALQGFARAFELAPDNLLPLARLVEAMEFVRGDDPRISALRRAAQGGDADCLLSLAKVEERLGHYDAAWQALVQANALDSASLPPWPADDIRDRLISATRQNLPAPDHNDRGTVFIVGMFRTGSTLLEQIFAAHSRFTPLGESEFWPREIARTGGGMVIPGSLPDGASLNRLGELHRAHLEERGASTGRVTDKRPDNLFHIPLIASALPSAKFIITDRDWRDTLLSVFATRLHPQHGYACRPRDIYRQLQLCRDLTNSWVEGHPERVRYLRYEDLIAAPEKTLRPLFEWLGEVWEPECLEFHRLGNAVRTASVWQVREPLNTRRQGRWRRFEAPLRAIFGDDLDAGLLPTAASGGKGV